MRNTAGVALRTPRDLGAFVRSARQKMGLSQQQLADKVGVSGMWVSHLERGNDGARFNLILRTLSVLALQLRGAADDADDDDFDFMSKALEA